MCSYCGCTSISVIGRFTEEHESIVNAVGALRRVAMSGDVEGTRRAAEALAALLDPHTLAEETSLFTELRTDPVFGAHVDLLCREHDEIAAALARVVEGDLGGADGLATLLRSHIDKEENGLFPGAAIALDGPAWERVVARAG